MPVKPPVVADGDSGFVGVNMRMDPALLPPGYVSEAKNKRFVNGTCKTRNGIKKIQWSNKSDDYYDNSKTYSANEVVRYAGTADVLTVGGGPSSNPTKGPYFKAKTTTTGVAPYGDGSSATNWDDLSGTVFPFVTSGSVKGAGVFRDPNGVEYLIIATNDGFYQVSEDASSELINSVTNDGDVEFTQCFNAMIAFRGDNHETLAMTDLATGFVSVTTESSDTSIDENDSDGTVTIPNSRRGIFFQNRLLAIFDRDKVLASDYLNYTRYQPVLSNFRINQGSEDELVAIYKYDNNTVICFKERSVYIVGNIYGNLQDIYLDEFTSEYGCVAAKSVVKVGKDIWFLSDRRGVVSIAQSGSGVLQGVDMPVSDSIQPLIDRINWSAAHKSVAKWHDNKYYLAVPLDGFSPDQEPDTILVYDFKNKAWAGYDQSDTIGRVSGSTYYGIKDFMVLNFKGLRRLFFLNTDGTINLYDDPVYSGFVDEVVNLDNTSTSFGTVTYNQISDELTTRGYICGIDEPKRFRRVNVNCKTWNPSFTVTSITDGIEEETTRTMSSFNTIGAKTFDRTKYTKPFHKSDYTSGSDDRIAYLTVTEQGTGYGYLQTVPLTISGTAAGSAYSDTNGLLTQATLSDAGSGYVATSVTVGGSGSSGAVSAYINTDCTNLSDDFFTKYREDYSIDMDTAFDLGTNGVDPDLHQESHNKYTLNDEGRHLRVKVSNTQGRFELTSVTVEATSRSRFIGEHR